MVKKDILQRFKILDSINDMTEEDVKDTSDTPMLSQWGIINGGKYYPTLPTIQKLESGYYEIEQDRNYGIVFQKKEVNTDELVSLPSSELQDILLDIENFWEREDKYREYNFVHKRGILLYGQPGCGKSAIIQLCTKHLIEEKNGIVINISNIEHIDLYSRAITKLRQIEPERPIIVIMEDIDSLMKEGSWVISLILNILDGIKQIDNVVYIATTNYPEKLEKRITNRPSRFDRRYEIELPSRDVRESYLHKKLSKEDLENIDLEKWLDESDGYSLSHMRELVISVIAMDNSFEDTVERLNELSKDVEIESGKRNVGFSGYG